MFREKGALYAAYMPMFSEGGIFVPTTRDYKLGEDIYLLLSCPTIRSAIGRGQGRLDHAGQCSGGRTQGVGVRFPADEKSAPCAPGSRKRSAPRCRRPSPRRRSEPTRLVVRAAHGDAATSMYVDSHCHLSFPELAEKLRRSGSRWPLPTSTGRSASAPRSRNSSRFTRSPRLRQLLVQRRRAPGQPGCARAGVDDLLALAAKPKVVAIGETGLDYYRLGQRSVADMEWQRQRYRVHIRASRASGLPLVIHTRSASADTLALLQEEGEGQAQGVFHCFTETAEVARAALDLGFYIRSPAS